MNIFQMDRARKFNGKMLVVIILSLLSFVNYLFQFDLFFGASLYFGPLFIMLLKPVIGRNKTIITALTIIGIVASINGFSSIYLFGSIEIIFLVFLHKPKEKYKSYIKWELVFWGLFFLLTFANNLFAETEMLGLSIFGIVYFFNSLLNALLGDVLQNIKFISDKFSGEEEGSNFYLADLVFSIVLFSIGTLLTIYLVAATMNFKQIIYRSAKDYIQSELETYRYSLSVIQEPYNAYARIGNTVGKQYLKDAIDHRSIQRGSIHILFNDHTIYPQLDIEKDYQLKEIEDKFYMLSQADRKMNIVDLFVNKYDEVLYIDTILYGKVMLRVPLIYYVEEAYQLYFSQIPFLIIVAIILLLVIQKILAYAFRDYQKLISITENLPDKIREKDHIEWPNFVVYELKFLVIHFKEMASQLTSLFEEAKEINQELEAQALVLIESEKKMKNIALTDSLTQLPNRYNFYTFLENQLSDFSKDRFAVAFIDLDRFKYINDTYGHDVGDKLLIEVGNRLSEFFFNNQDTHYKVARLGGDEFVVLLKYECEDQLEEKLQELLGILNQTVEIEGHLLLCIASIGVAKYPEDGKDIKHLLQKADTSMYKSKADGGNKVTYYRGEIKAHSEGVGIDNSEGGKENEK